MEPAMEAVSPHPTTIAPQYQLDLGEFPRHDGPAMSNTSNSLLEGFAPVGVRREAQHLGALW
jgi:hypothetical protein